MNPPLRELILFGYGNQGRAWAHNLRDSGWEIHISGRPENLGGKSLAQARADGFSTLQLAEIAEKSSPVAWLSPDHSIADLQSDLNRIRTEREGKNAKPRAFIFAHGFALVHGGAKPLPQDDAILVAPKGIGTKLRNLFKEGSGVLGVLGVAQDASGQAWSVAKAVGSGLGCDRVGLVRSTFAEETNADLLSEQSILCGALPRLIRSSVDFLIAQGVDPKIATFECLNESKLIIEMMVERGIVGMYEAVSANARIGGLRAAERVLPQKHLDQALGELWQEIQDGTFAKALNRELAEGEANSRREMEAFRASKTDQYR